MEFYIFILVVLLAIVAVSVAANGARKRQRKVEDLLAGVGERLGLALVKGNLFNQPSVHGAIGDFRVVIRRYQRPEEGTSPNRIRIFINHSLPIHGVMGVTRESRYTLDVKAWTGEDMITGDRAFDDAMYITGTCPYQIAALFSGDIRKRFLSVAAKGVDINLTSSWLEIYLDEGGLSVDEIVACIREAVSISADLEKAGDIRGRLMENIRGDIDPAVRAACISHLAAHFPVDGEIRTLFRDSMNDADLYVRVEAARRLGSDGMGYLSRVLEEEKNLGEEAVLAIVRAMGETRYATGIPSLKKLFSERTGKGLELAILEAFREIGDTGLSGFLVSYIERREGDVLRAVLGALGSCGTVDAVELLLRLAKSSLDPFLRSDVQKAVAEIQSRLGGADAGWLSVTETGGTEGALSMSGGPGEGALSGESGEGEGSPLMGGNEGEQKNKGVL